VEDIPTFAFEKELLARHGLTIVTTNVRGGTHVKILEGNKELTQWLPASFFAGWVQGFAYAMRKQESST
jgi:hypothetical protein